VNNPALIAKISGKFAQTDYLYIADGHHRAASAVKVGLKRRAAKPGTAAPKNSLFSCRGVPAERARYHGL